MGCSDYIEGEVNNMSYIQSLKYRLFCESCTGIACYGSEPVNGPMIICLNCGHQTPVKKENWISLSESEIKRVNMQQSSKEETTVKKK